MSLFDESDVDEPDFELLPNLIDAEYRGSELALKLRETFQNFDLKKAEENHFKLKSYLFEMRHEFEELLENYEDDELEDVYDSEFLSEWNWKLFDSEFGPCNTSSDSFQLIFDELSLSNEGSGAFGNAELLEGCVGWQNEMNHSGFLISPFIPRNVLKSTVMWSFDSNNFMSSLAVSPIMSRLQLHNLVDEILQTLPGSGFDWIGIALLVNANSDLRLLDVLYRNGGEAISAGYCFFPTSGGQSIENEGVCGPLVGKSWFASVEVFDRWKEKDLIGLLDEDENPPEVLKNLINVATMYLATTDGLKESTRSKLAKSVVFGNLLIAFRMINEFKFGRATIQNEMNSDSPLIRSVLYWMPEIDLENRERLLSEGLVFPEEVGKLLIQGWKEDFCLIF